MEISENKDDNGDMSGLPPKTTHVNQQVSAQLLEMEIDEYHCRPNLQSKSLVTAIAYWLLILYCSDIPTIR